MKPIDRKILQLAIPSIISNITVPLLGLVDIAIVGHLGASYYIGAIAVGTTMFSLVYWVFGFLRMGTSGMTAQAYGKRDHRETALLFQRSITVGAAIGLLLIACRPLLTQLMLTLIPCSPEVGRLARTYFEILIWGAPAVLSLYGFYGWYIGMQKSVYTMWIAIMQNILNIVISATLVFGFHLKVDGVACGTLSAQYLSFLIAAGIWLARYRQLGSLFHLREAFRKDKLVTFFHVNSDIFFRTLCIVGVNFFFTSAGAREGTTLLAVNTLLMQFYLIYSYIIDGYAYAAEAMTGAAIGAKDRHRLRLSIRALLKWAFGVTLLFTAAYTVAGKSLVHLLTNDADVTAAARPYFYWVLFIPLAGFAAFLWDGILVGAVKSRAMLHATFGATAVFFLIYFMFRPLLQNHALWLAFLCYLFMRGALETRPVLRLQKPGENAHNDRKRT